MSWVVEQSDDASSVQVNGNTVTCTKDGYYGSPIHALYKDAADHNGDYFWEIEVQRTGGEDAGGSVSVGVTQEQSFKSGWGLKAMKYLGNLSDGSALLVSQFGDPIKQGDKVGILLRLSDADLKLYLFHNDRPLGLAFHVNAPYPKPLYPVVSFDANGQVKITRSQRIPTGLDRSAVQYQGVEGTWKISEYSQHPDCVGSHFEIKRSDGNQNQYRLHTHIANNMSCQLEHNPTANTWTVSPVMATMMMGPPDLMQKERIINQLMSGIRQLDVDSHQNLIIRTNSDEQVRLQRYTKAGPPAVTDNIFA